LERIILIGCDFYHNNYCFSDTFSEKMKSVVKLGAISFLKIGLDNKPFLMYIIDVVRKQSTKG